MTNHLWVAKAFLYLVVLVGASRLVMQWMNTIENPFVGLAVAAVHLLVYCILAGKLLEWLLTR